MSSLTNDQVILKEILTQRKQEIANDLDDASFFELFSVEQALKDYDLSWDELESGIVGKGGDGGIDGIYLFVNRELIREDSDISSFRGQIAMELPIVQAKQTMGFSETAIQKFHASSREVNTVNCVGVMGKGIALQFKQAYPDNFEAYARLQGRRGATGAHARRAHGSPAQSEIHLLVYEPHGAPGPDAMPVAKKDLKMTRARALLIRLTEMYRWQGYRLSQLDIQKLAYFLQLAGEPLQLRYEKGHYGPYAHNLNHVLQRMEGRYLRGYGDGSQRAEIHALPQAVEVADAFLAKDMEAQERLATCAQHGVVAAGGYRGTVGYGEQLGKRGTMTPQETLNEYTKVEKPLLEQLQRLGMPGGRYGRSIFDGAGEFSRGVAEGAAAAGFAAD